MVWAPIKFSLFKNNCFLRFTPFFKKAELVFSPSNIMERPFPDHCVLITNTKYTTLFMNDRLVLYSNYGVDLVTAFKSSAFSKTYITTSWDKLEYQILRIDNNTLTINDLIAINNMEKDFTLLELRIFHELKDTHPRIYGRYYRNAKLTQASICYLKTPGFNCTYWMSGDLTYIYLQDVDWDNLTESLIMNFKINDRVKIIIANREYNLNRYREKFICRHDWFRNLKKNRLILLDNSTKAK